MTHSEWKVEVDNSIVINITKIDVFPKIRCACFVTRKITVIKQEVMYKKDECEVISQLILY